MGVIFNPTDSYATTPSKNSKNFNDTESKSGSDYTKPASEFKEKDEAQNLKPPEQDAEKNENPLDDNATRTRQRKGTWSQIDSTTGLPMSNFSEEFPGYTGNMKKIVKEQ